MVRAIFFNVHFGQAGDEDEVDDYEAGAFDFTCIGTALILNLEVGRVATTGKRTPSRHAGAQFSFVQSFFGGRRRRTHGSVTRSGLLLFFFPRCFHAFLARTPGHGHHGMRGARRPGEV